MEQKNEHHKSIIQEQKEYKDSKCSFPVKM